MKDWTGNSKSIFVCNGASNHSDTERQNDDYYATDPNAIHKLCSVEKFSPIVWECACGGGHLVKALQENGYDVIASDIVDRGCPKTLILDFFDRDACLWNTRLTLWTTVAKSQCFLNSRFWKVSRAKSCLRNIRRKEYGYFSERIQCAKNGDFELYKQSGMTAVAYAWFVWEKGFRGETTVGWI